jgi:hypothetical protein
LCDYSGKLRKKKKIGKDKYYFEIPETKIVPK